MSIKKTGGDIESSPPASTESSNPHTADLAHLDTIDMLKLINVEDSSVALRVREALPTVASAVDAIGERMTTGGRLIYLGAGTSGRLGVLDAAECPPTFGTAPGRVIGLIAGGQAALSEAVEGAEDCRESGPALLAGLQLSPCDSVVGITASGSTPFVLSALEFAALSGALTVGLTCNEATPLCRIADICIEIVTGAEVIRGSTRMKAGTAQKMVLNMISTGVMVRLGRTLGNQMVGMQPRNAKLRRRALGMVMELTGQDESAALTALESSGWQVAVAVLMLRQSIDAETAAALLTESGHRLLESELIEQ